jgi:glycosyltransferase involved in cell wall biosynthesis
MANIQISFLIAAHNEEKIIARTVSNLLRLPSENYEIILGLDGCTDGTENVIKEFKKKSEKIKYYKLNLRQGKPAVINKIIKKARGKIIVINDADWFFEVKRKKYFKEFFSVLDNPKVGGIAEYFPAEWDEEKIKNGNLGYKMVAYSSFFWFQFQKEKLTYKLGPISYLKEPTMFLTNIFKKDLYEENFSLGDDFERTKNIMDMGYKIAIFDNINMPRRLVTYNNVNVRDLFRLKVRTAIARKQIKNEQNVNIKNYYAPAVVYMFKNSWKKSTRVGLIVSFWIILTSFATFLARFKKVSTKEGWKIRMKR